MSNVKSSGSQIIRVQRKDVAARRMVRVSVGMIADANLAKEKSQDPVFRSCRLTGKKFYYV